MRCLIIIPAYNEADNITTVITSVVALKAELEILVVNDGSKDETVSRARACDRVTVIDLACNLGIGGAVQTGFLYARQNDFDIVVKFDGDGQH